MSPLLRGVEIGLVHGFLVTGMLQPCLLISYTCLAFELGMPASPFEMALALFVSVRSAFPGWT